MLPAAVGTTSDWGRHLGSMTEIELAVLPGSATFDGVVDGGSFVVRGTGTDVYNASDSFHFVYHPVVGDFTFTLRVAGYYGYLQMFTKAMTMFRTDLVTNALGKKVSEKGWPPRIWSLGATKPTLWTEWQAFYRAGTNYPVPEKPGHPPPTCCSH